MRIPEVLRSLSHFLQISCFRYKKTIFFGIYQKKSAKCYSLIDQVQNLLQIRRQVYIEDSMCIDDWILGGVVTAFSKIL